MALVGVGQRSKRGLRLWCGRLGGDGESSLDELDDARSGAPLVPVAPGTVRWWPVGGVGVPALCLHPSVGGARPGGTCSHGSAPGRRGLPARSCEWRVRACSAGANRLLAEIPPAARVSDRIPRSNDRAHAGESAVTKRRTRWTSELVAEAIRGLRLSGVVPSQSYVVKHRPDLYGAAQRYCGGFRNALLAAGEDPKAVAISSRATAGVSKTKWTGATILATLRDRQHDGLPINVDGMKRAGLGGLLHAARRTFGSYERAVEEVGLKYADVRLTAPDWSDEAVLDAISIMAGEGHDVNVSTAQHLNSGLVAAAIKFFGSWDAALGQAGFDPRDIRLDVNTEAGKGRVFENLCDALFGQIRPAWQLNFRYDAPTGPLLPDAFDPGTGEWIDFKLAAWGMSVSSTIRKYSPYASSLRFITLQGSRSSLFGIEFQSVFDFEPKSSTPELRAIFEALHLLDGEAVPGTKLDIWSTVWSKEKLLLFIQQLPVSVSSALAVQRSHPREYSAVVRYFGGWYQGVDAAGLPGAEIRRRRLTYTREDINQFIQVRLARGEGLSAKAVTDTPSGNGLYQAANRLYGGWDDALIANGIPSGSMDGFTLSKGATLARLYEFIRRRGTAGEALSAMYIRDHFKAEYKVAFRLAGGWREAVEACGINYERVSDAAPPQRLTKEDVDAYIRARSETGLPLNTAAVIHDNRPIHTASCRAIYGSWKAAIEANGIAYQAVKVK